MKPIRFVSVCSGIEAASVAWHPLGWRAAWLSEIEPFPSAVLAHHYPDVPNLGDMTKLPERIRSGEVEAPDVFCGGTPCQAFSVAGLRKSLDDARGNLSLTFCEIANEVDTARLDRGEPEAIVFWENVPGVLNTKDNAFGCFIAGLAGEDDPLQPPGGKWSNAGYVLGPKRAVAWRVLDAQYFGLAQRRRRVFVVASARKGFDPAAVLFEFDGVRRDTPPSREAGQGTPRGAAPGVDVRNGAITGGVAHTVQAGKHAPDPGGTPHVLHPTSFAIQAGALRTNPASGPDGVGVQEGHAYTLEARAEVQAVCCVHGTQDPCVSNHTAFALGRNNGGENAIAFAQNSRDEVRLMNGDGQIVGALAAEPGMKQTCYVAQAVSLRGREGGATAELGDEVGNCLRASGGGGDRAHVLAPVAVRDTYPTITSNYGKQVDSSDTALGPNVVFPAMKVRRMTPCECERLQGFPDNYTRIPWKLGYWAADKHSPEVRAAIAEQCPDGPRYKALGNSWAVPNVRWIGRRIDAHLRALSGSISTPTVTEKA